MEGARAPAGLAHREPGTPYVQLDAGAEMPKNQTCALRALTLCDGQQLEMPDRALTSCLCWLQERAEKAELGRVARAAAEERAAMQADLVARHTASGSVSATEALRAAHRQMRIRSWR